jgi:hypothetical protein
MINPSRKYFSLFAMSLDLTIPENYLACAGEQTPGTVTIYSNGHLIDSRKAGTIFDLICNLAEWPCDSTKEKYDEDE